MSAGRHNEGRLEGMNSKGQSSKRCSNRYANLIGIIERLFALGGVIVLSPLLVLIAICVALDSSGGCL